jgi:hypothetical protein
VFTAGITSIGVLTFAKPAGTGYGTAALCRRFPVISGDACTLRLQGRAAGPGTWRLSVRLFWYDADDTFLFPSLIAILAGDGPDVLTRSAEGTIPAGARQARLVFAVGLTGTAAVVEVGGPVVERITTAVASTRAGVDALDAVLTTPGTGLASRVATVEAEVRDPAAGLASVRASVDPAQTALATVEGHAQASYTLRAHAGSAEAGLEIVAADDPVAGPAAIVRIRGDQLIVDGDTHLDDAFIERIVVRQAEVDTLRVNTLMIGDRAVTVPVYLAFPGSIRPEGGAGTNIAAGSIRREGFATVITLGCQMGGWGYGECIFELRRGGVLINRFPSGTGPSGANQSIFSQYVDTDAGAGVTHYRVDAIWSGYRQPIITQRILNLVQTKR